MFMINTFKDLTKWPLPQNLYKLIPVVDMITLYPVITSILLCELLNMKMFFCAFSPKVINLTVINNLLFLVGHQIVWIFNYIKSWEILFVTLSLDVDSGFQETIFTFFLRNISFLMTLVGLTIKKLTN